MVRWASMKTAIAAAVLAGVAACRVDAGRATLVALRPACDDAAYWDGHACRARGDGAAKVAAGRKALAALDVDVAQKALAEADRAGPLDHTTNVTLWEQRGIAIGYVDDPAGASAAFDMLLALDPGHLLSYTLSPKATFVFEKVRNDQKARGVPALDVRWPHGPRVGDPVPLDVEVVADPKRFLSRATVFVRSRGEPAWRAADLALAGAAEHHLVLPPVDARQPVSLELYLRAYDDHGNEVLSWADPARPREIPLGYVAPVPWYRRGWFYAAVGTAVAVTVGVTVYELTIAPPDKVTGSVSVQ